MSAESMLFLAALAGAGLFAGFIGGLFGVGGGVVVVPALFAVLSVWGVDETVRMHVSVGTSLATIISTSWRSLSAHAKAGAVNFEILRGWAPSIAVGAVLGSVLAGFANTTALLLIFGFGLLLVAAQMGFSAPSGHPFKALPTGIPRAVLASGIGGLSALMGIGGGAFGATLMTLCGRPIHQAVATASGFGAAIAAPAALGYVITGWGREGLPPWSLGFVNMPGFVLLAVLTAVTAPVGAALAHRLPQKQLKQAFAVFLALVALNMLREAIS
jgi:uncharacterized membrane protein YfcA